MHIAHAHQRTQDVFRADVVTNLAGRDRPVQKGGDCPSEPIERIGEQFRILVGGQRQRRRHALFCGNEFHIRAQPAPQRVDGLRLLLELFGQIGKLLHLAAVHRLEQRFARGEMPVKRADAHAGGARDRFEACVRAAGAENRLCRLEHTLAIADGIDARLSHALVRQTHAARTSNGGLKNGGILRI